jgi:hypothetical protein
MLMDRIAVPLLPPKRGRGHPKTYFDRLFLKALVIMIVRQLHKVHGLLSALEHSMPSVLPSKGGPGRLAGGPASY